MRTTSHAWHRHRADPGHRPRTASRSVTSLPRRSTAGASAVNECNDTSGGCGPDGFNDTQSCGILLFDAGQGDRVTRPAPRPTTSARQRRGLRLGLLHSAVAVHRDQRRPVRHAAGQPLRERLPRRRARPPSTTPRCPAARSASRPDQHERADDRRPCPSPTATSITGSERGRHPDRLATTPPGDKAPKLTVATSSFDTSNTGGIENDSTSVATANEQLVGRCVQRPGRLELRDRLVRRPPTSDFFPWTPTPG